jgi:hypothetical protein
MSKPVTRNLSAYDGMTFIGTLKITKPARRRPSVKVRDRDGKSLGTFTSQKAGMAAINRTYERRRRDASDG